MENVFKFALTCDDENKPAEESLRCQGFLSSRALPIMEATHVNYTYYIHYNKIALRMPIKVTTKIVFFIRKSMLTRAWNPSYSQPLY